MLKRNFIIYIYIYIYTYRNLKKTEDAVVRTEKEIEENKNHIQILKEQLTALDERAAEVIDNSKKAEVCIIFALFFRLHLKWS